MIHVVFHSSLSHESFHGFHANYTETQRGNAVVVLLFHAPVSLL